MGFRNQVEWALHCCSVLSALAPGQSLATKTLAEFHDIPKEYLAKALQALAKAGIVEGIPGPGGGYRLARPPKEISFLQVIEAIDGGSHTFQCSEIRANNPCLRRTEKRFSKACAVARVMHRADEAWRGELRSVSLQELGQSVAKDVPEAQLRRNLDWLIAQ